MRKGKSDPKTVHISDLFEKYKKTLRAPQGSVITCFTEVLQEVLQLTVSEEKIAYSVQDKTLFVRASGPVRSEILFHKKELIAHLKGRLGEQSAPKDIL